MRVPRVLLLLCLVVGLPAVGIAARAHVREVRAALENAARRTLHRDLAERGVAIARRIHATLRERTPDAVYDGSGRLLRPAPPAVARPYRPPVGSVVPFVLERDEPERALRYATTSAERVLVLLRRGDDAALAEALNEEALAGTELAYRVRLQRFRLAGAEPDAAWIDDVGALLDGPSDRLARWLLREAGIDAARVPGRAEREALAQQQPEPGFGVDAGHFFLVAEDGDRLRLTRVPRAEVDLGEGPEAEPLPEPFAAAAVHGRLDAAALEARAQRETRKLSALYVLAGLVLLAGTGYALVAIGRAHRLAAAKSEFVANVTHELKTPLANIRLFAESLREGRVREPEQEEFLATILDEAGRLDDLVEGLLHAARGPRLRAETLDPAALLRETAARWDARLRRDGCTLAVEAPALPAVRGDREALLRALGNLVDNARKYARADRRIELSGARANGSVKLTVRDHGPGIPVRHRDHVLQPFTRLERADRKETKGTGLGLSLVVACMEAHGGRVEIGAGTDGGAAVTLVLPTEGTA